MSNLFWHILYLLRYKAGIFCYFSSKYVHFLSCIWLTLCRYAKFGTNQADKSKAVIGQYYASDWLDSADRTELPIYLKLADLYEHFILQLLPLSSNEDQENNDEPVSIEDKLQKAQQIESLKKQFDKLKSKLKTEKTSWRWVWFLP